MNYYPIDISEKAMLIGCKVRIFLDACGCVWTPQARLVEFDLKKDISTPIRVYNDQSELTKDFNLNLLTRINRELGADFQVDKYQHFGVYNPVLGAMESYIIATEEQDVYVATLEREFHFDSFEAIHLEYSWANLFGGAMSLPQQGRLRQNKGCLLSWVCKLE